VRAAIAGVIACAGALVLLSLNSGPDPDSVPTAEEVGARTMSPFCEGLTLNECPHSKSTVLRSEIEAMVGKGATNREIDDWMARNYGIVSQGRPGGGLAWIAPPALAVLGLIAVFSILRKRKLPAARSEAALPKLSDADEAKLAADFQGYVRGSE
jgi:cytochrome c-type biogenesis protein CcmH/NrfF